MAWFLVVWKLSKLLKVKQNKRKWQAMIPYKMKKSLLGETEYEQSGWTTTLSKEEEEMQLACVSEQYAALVLAQQKNKSRTLYNNM